MTLAAAGDTRTSRAADLLVFLCFFGAGAVLYSPIFDILPLRGDNLDVLAWVDQASPHSLLQVDPQIYPEWRPLAYLTIWLEHRLVQLNAVALHHAVNLSLFALCATLICRLAREMAGSLPAGIVAGAIFLIDMRTIESLIWIVERQTLIACVCGLLTLLIAWRADTRLLNRPEWLATVTLLIAGALGKEYGLAFAIALAVHGAAIRRLDLLSAGAAALTAYAALRLAIPGGIAPYCEDMGFFFGGSHTCFDGWAVSSAPQMLYNVAATAFGTAIPGLLSEIGSYQLRVARFVCGGIILILALAGVVAGPRFLRLLALVPIANAALSFMLYRPRNQLVGLCAIAIAAGVGAIATHRWLDRFGRVRLLRASLATAGALAVTLQVLRTHERVDHEVASMLDQDPCAAGLRRNAPYGDAFVKRVKVRFALDDPTCGDYDGSSDDATARF